MTEPLADHVLTNLESRAAHSTHPHIPSEMLLSLIVEVRRSRGTAPAPPAEGDAWVGANGKVHLQRRRFWVGTRGESLVPKDFLVMLCGKRSDLQPSSEPVTCGVCLKAANTGAHVVTR